MVSCPDCGGEMKWKNPFYVCQICGLALRKHEYQRYRQKKEEETWEMRYGEDEEEKKKEEYEKWFLSGDKK